MICSHCETPLPDAASFCWNCGEAQQRDAQTGAPRWETCEILAEPAGVWTTRLRFWAKATGPQGEYSVGSSRDFIAVQPNKEDRQAFAALNGLIARLVLQDEWERLQAKGPDWYSHRFRRRIVAPSPLPSDKMIMESDSRPNTTTEGRREPAYSGR
jgi:hypothetical protein